MEYQNEIDMFSNNYTCLQIIEDMFNLFIPILIELNVLDFYDMFNSTYV